MPDKKEFITLFKAESETLLTKLDNGLVELEKEPGNIELIKELNRESHTLKGSARVFGFEEIQEIAHRIEDIFEKVAQKGLIFNPNIADKIFKGLDTVRTILQKITKEGKPDVDVSGVCKGLEECLVPPQAGEQKLKAKSVIAEKAEKKEDTKKKEETKKQEEDKQEPEKKKEKTDNEQHAEHEEYIRVPVDRVNKLLNLASEMVINKMKSSQNISQVRKLSRPTKEIQRDFSDLGEKIKEKFPLESDDAVKLFSRCNAGLQKLREDFLNLYDNISAEAFSLEPAIDELQNKMKELRMLPCSTIFEIFPRMVRDIASREKQRSGAEDFRRRD